MDVRPFVLAIDPGSARSAFVGINRHGTPVVSGRVPNDELLDALRDGRIVRELGGTLATAVVIENIEPRFGLNVGWETLDTARWTGRFQEAALPIAAVLLQRSQVLSHLGVVTRGPNKTTADAGVRAALIDRYGGHEGKATAIGLKASPGPLYGLTADRWAALAVAVTYADGRQR
jgi:hypothetical protein